MYDFHDLSPPDFEELVRDLLQAELGIALESFGPGRDSGIDCRFSSGSESTIVQAKHYLRSGPNKLLRVLRDENQKVFLLKPSRYVLATSVSMTPGLKDRIVEAMPHAPLVPADIIGQEDLNNLLGRHPDIEKKHFKLWLGSSAVLERILHSGIYNRSETELEIIRDLIPKFVQNNSVNAAERILEDSGTLIITGHPGVGKTTLARMLVWLHASQEWEIFVVDDIVEAFEISSPKGKKLIFFDDFLGQVQLSADHVRGLDQRLPPFIQRVKANKNLRFVLTTREYILSQAEMLSRRLASREMAASRYVLNVGVYTKKVRAKILYNHLYFSGLSSDQIDQILENEFYLDIINHPNFNPRLIELLTSEDYASLSGASLREAIQLVLDNPDQLWEQPYREHISDHGRALMLSLLLHPNSVVFPRLKDSFGRMATALGAPIAEAKLHERFAATLRELEGSVVAIVDRRASFSNPGVRDFLQVAVIKDELLDGLVPHVTTFVELKQAWTIFIDRQPRPMPVPSDAPIWSAALARIQQRDSGDLLDRLDIALSVFDHFSDAHSLDTAREVINQIQDEGVLESDARDAAAALENASLHALSMDDQEWLTEVLTAAVADLVKQTASDMQLEDLESLDEALFTYGSDPTIAEEAIQGALERYIEEIDSEISELGDLEELEEFESRLNSLMVKRNYSGKSPRSDLEYRRERLEEKEYESDYEGFHSSSSGSLRVDSSDDEIRSMFGDLRNAR